MNLDFSLSKSSHEEDQSKLVVGPQSRPNVWYDQNMQFCSAGDLTFFVVRLQSRCPSLMNGMTKTSSFVLLGILHFLL